jgi:hypothetical protein
MGFLLVEGRLVDCFEVGRAINKCLPRLDGGAVKTVSRAERGRSEAERLDGAESSRTID